MKTSLLPSLVELASDDNISVRSSAVAAAVFIIPFLNKGKTNSSHQLRQNLTNNFLKLVFQVKLALISKENLTGSQQF